MPKVTSQAASSSSRTRGRRVSTTLAEINVIPLVDVMLVLLIVFMVAAPMMQKGVEVNLPVAQNTGRMNETRVYITVPLSFRKDRRVYIDDEGIPLSALAERARQVMQARDEKEVFLRSDGQVQVQDVMDVMNSLKGGGVERVGMLTTTARR